MKRVEDKALQFMAALSDVYRDEEVRELSAFSKLEMIDSAIKEITGAT